MLPQTTTKAPRRKLRGKKGYFKAVLRKAEQFVVETHANAWWDLWHYHADWPGWGNARWKYRLGHLRALAVVFRKIIETSRIISVPFQTWLFLDGEDAGQDAVYLHSPNPNGTPFPLKVEGVSWDTTALRGVLADLLPGVEVRVGRRTSIDGGEDGSRPRTVYFVYSPGIGVPIE